MDQPADRRSGDGAATGGRGSGQRRVAGQDLYTSEHLKSREFYRETKYFAAERGKSASEWEEGSSLSWSMPAHLSAHQWNSATTAISGKTTPTCSGSYWGLSDDQVAKLVADGVVY